MKAVLLAALAILAAGCATPAPTDKDPATPPDGEAATGLFLEPMTVVEDTAEPGVLLGPDGTVWVHAPGGLWSLAPNATEWVAADFSPGVVVGGDADLAFASDGTMYYTDLENLAAISVFTSRDNGVTWTEQPVASDMPLDDRQWITTGIDVSPTGAGAESAFLVYNQLTTGVWMTKSQDGVAWTPSPVFATTLTTQLDIQTMGNVVVDADGTIYIAYTLGSAGSPLTPPIGHDYIVQVSVSKDGGLTWTHTRVIEHPTNLALLFPILAVDPAGTVYLTWAMEEGGSTDIFLASTKDKGATWTAPLRVNRDAGSHAQPWVSAGDAPGEVVLVWYAANETAPPNQVEGAWHVAGAVSRNADASAPAFTAFRVSPGSVHEGPICVDGVLCQGGRDLLDFFEARIDGEDRVHVAYASSVDGVKVVYQVSAGPL